MFNTAVFYNKVRNSPFGGTLTPSQVDGMGKILKYWEAHYPKDDLRELAYVLATIYHETGHTMQPISEWGGEKYLKSKPYYPWYGRGLVQITWEENYKKYNIYHPEDALQWGIALFVAFDGMKKGTFTGRKLSQYFSHGTEDAKGARRIINGQDKASVIATYYLKFRDALRASAS